MTNIYTGKIFLKIATHALLVGLQEVPILGSAIKIAGGCWQILRDAQAETEQEARITQLEQAALVTPEDARLLAGEVITAEQQSGKVINPELAAAVTDLISVMPAQIRERTHATLSHARRLCIKAVTVLPVTAQFKEVEQETFYTGLFPQRRPQFQPGAALPNYNDEWVLERLIGAGGFGEVWLAKHKRMRSRPPMAIKFCQDDNSAKMLRDEADKLDALCEKLPVGTPHVVALLDFQFNVTPYWLAMEYVDGGTLESRMRLGAMDWPAAWKLFAPLLDGMSRIHKLNIVHRDLKPSNILLPDGNNPRIADFGIGKILAEQQATTRRTSRSFTVRGTGSLGYMSPEQEEGILDAHPSDDVYALGVILWQMLTGRLEPLRFPAHVQKLPAPDTVKNAILHCVFMPREERPADAGILLSQLATSTPDPVLPSVPVEEPIKEVKTAPNSSAAVVTEPPKVASIADIIHLAVEQEDPVGQNLLGDAYYHGKDIPQDYTQAAEWYRSAAEQANADGQYHLGNMYEHGTGVAQNDTEAAKWYQLAAEQGHASGQNSLGDAYLHGKGVLKNYLKALKWYRLAAEQGDADGQYKLGVMYYYGSGVTEDEVEAVKWYRLAAEQGHAEAQYQMGDMYEYGKGVTKDYTEAVKWYRLAAEQGHARGQNALGIMYLYGKGVPQSNTEAAKWNSSVCGHYLIYPNGTVTDTRNGLMWQRCTYGQTWNGTTCVGDYKNITWNDAMPNGKQKTWPAFAGYTDWRLPTIDELKTLIVEGSSPAIDQTAFPNTPIEWFWSASSGANDSSFAWVVYFDSGYVSINYRTFSSAVRLVRGGQ